MMKVASSNIESRSLLHRGRSKARSLAARFIKPVLKKLRMHAPLSASLFMRKSAAERILSRTEAVNSSRFRRLQKLALLSNDTAEHQIDILTDMQDAIQRIEALAQKNNADAISINDSLRGKVDTLSRQLANVNQQFEDMRQLVQHIEASSVTRFDYLEADRNIYRQINSADIRQMGERVRTIGRMLQPHASVEHQKIRLGAVADGGYVCLDDFAGLRTALSFGIDKDVSWDLDAAARGLIIHQFDHTIDGPPVDHANFRFNKQMIVPVAANGNTSIRSILDDRQLSAPASVFLKIDIEGSEWDVFDAASEQDLNVFSQIVCEFHGFQFLDDDNFYAKVTRVLEKMNRHFRVVHVHGNNYCPMFSLGGVPFPSLLEVTFVNQSRSTFRESAEVFPTELDHPNNLSRPDFFLGSFRF